MLPSFRLIVAGFLCGFVVVYAGLRLATSLNSIHQALPIMAAQAAPAPLDGIGNAHGTPAVLPTLYGMRFVSAAATAPVLASVTPPAFAAAAPAPSPPIEDLAKDAATVAQAKVEVAAIDPAPAPATEPAPAMTEPEPLVPEAANDAAEATASPASEPAELAAIDPSSLPGEAGPVATTPVVVEQPAPDAANPSQAAKTAAIGPETPPAELPNAGPATVEGDAATVAAPQPEAAKAAPRAAARSVRKKRKHALRRPARTASSFQYRASPGNNTNKSGVWN